MLQAKEPIFLSSVRCFVSSPDVVSLCHCFGTHLICDVRPQDLLDLIVNFRFELIHNNKSEVLILSTLSHTTPEFAAVFMLRGDFTLSSFPRLVLFL